MSTLDASQARDHIEMVDRILARTERSLRGGGEFFLVWGIVSAATTLTFQFVVSGGLPNSAFAFPAALIAAAVIFSIVRGRRLERERCSELTNEFFKVLWIAIGLAAFVNVAAFSIFPAVANSAIWTVTCSIVLLFIAVHGNRPALAGAIVLLASLAAANFMPAYAAYALAAGMLVGYSGFGLVSLLARD